MRTVGIILCVLIFIMSCVFMGMSIAVYATHRNWMELVQGPKGLKFQLNDLRTKNEALKEEYDKLDKDVKAERDAKEKTLATLQGQIATLTDDAKKLADEKLKLDEAIAQANAAVKTSGDSLEGAVKENEKLRGEIRTAQKERDEKFLEVVKLTDQFNDARGKLGRASERLQQITAQLALATRILDNNGLDLNVDPTRNPPKLKGEILALNADNLVEVSLGSDDGLKKGHTLEVSRQARYLGRLEVVSTQTDRAVAKVVPNFKRGPMQKGDHVATGTRAQ